MFSRLHAGSRPPLEFVGFLLGPAALAMLLLIIAQEIFGAVTTWLVIGIARDIADGHVGLASFGWIVAAQTLSYLAGAASWIFAERAGFIAYARYVLRFARDNRHSTALLTDAAAREGTEPFLTGEAFQICFSLIYELQFGLRLFFNILFNAIVFGIAIDVALPAAYGLALVLLVAMQWSLRKPLAEAYLQNQRMTNRMTARTYNAWDNVTTGNRYNFRLWHRDFRGRWRDALAAQVRAILMREGWSAASGVIALLIVLTATVYVAVSEAGNAALLIGLAATLPRQLEMSLDLHQLTAGATDLIAIWARMKGACEHLRPAEDRAAPDRIGFPRLTLRQGDTELPCRSLADALNLVTARPAGRISVRGDNGAGKSTLLMALKGSLRGRAFYWPAHDRLSFRFNMAVTDPVPDAGEEADEAEELGAREAAAEKAGYSSGERQLQALREIVAETDHEVYLLDEWDANLDAGNRRAAEALLAQLAGRAVVVEISHQDRRG